RSLLPLLPVRRELLRVLGPRLRCPALVGGPDHRSVRRCRSRAPRPDRHTVRRVTGLAAPLLHAGGGIAGIRSADCGTPSCEDAIAANRRWRRRSIIALPGAA